MNMTEETVAEVLALSERDRAFLAHRLIASLDRVVDSDVEQEWNDVIDRRSREMTEGRVDTRSEEQMLGEIRTRLNARHKAS